MMMEYEGEMELWGGYLERIEKVASENAVVILSRSRCCMCHAMKRLFCGMGVNPTVLELDDDDDDEEVKAVMAMVGGSTPTPTPTPTPPPLVFIGGKLVGGMDRVMASHINGSLVPLLKQAGALWL